MKSKIKYWIMFFILLSASFSIAAPLSEKTLGDNNAPIDIEFYFDLECPYSGNWYNDVFPEIKEDYIDEDKAKMVFKHYPLNVIHDNAEDAAIAAECAAEQGEFFDYIELVYENMGQLDSSDLLDYAEDISLDIDEFEECLDDEDIQKIIDEDVEEAKDLGLKGTPTFIINGVIYP